jgi:hypothetical protein
MIRKSQLTIITTLSILLTISLAIVSFCGAFLPVTYEREVPSLATQGIGQDLVDLFLVVPLLVILLIFVRKQNRAAMLLFSGTLFYILYSFIIYSLGIHFNYLFLLYCATLGLSTYLFIIMFHELMEMDVGSWFEEGVPVRLTGIYLIIVAILFYLLWLKEIVPAVIHNQIPDSVSDYNLLVNPVHVIDLAFALPGLILSAILLMKRKSLGYILSLTGLVFIIILAIALAAMVIMLKIKGISDESSIAGVFIILALLSSVILFLFLRKLKGSKRS